MSISYFSGYVDVQYLEIVSLNTFIGQKADGDVAISRGTRGK